MRLFVTYQLPNLFRFSSTYVTFIISDSLKKFVTVFKIKKNSLCNYELKSLVSDL